MSAVARLWREHRLMMLVFAGALAAAMFLGGRAAFFWLTWTPPDPQQIVLEGWMTPRYVAHTWHLDRDVVAGTFGLEPGGGVRVTLEQIAAAQGITLAELQARLRAAVIAHMQK